MAELPLRRYNAALRRPIFGTRRKGSTMINLLKSLFPAQAPGALTARELAYLEGAVSRIDLERREREIDRGLFRQPHPYF
jgi:hypothetical protein